MRQLDDRTLVSGQITPNEVPELKRQGITMIVNNRPDGEDAGQPSAAQIEEAAWQAGIEYRHIPIRRGPGPAEVEKLSEAFDACGNGKMLLFCRSGMRSTLAWAVVEAEKGRPSEELERRAAQAGYDISPVAHLL